MVQLNFTEIYFDSILVLPVLYGAQNEAFNVEVGGF